jgi:hypothetical protein
MPLDTPVYQFSQAKLQPYMNPHMAVEYNVNLSPGTYLQGTILGQVTTSASAVQTLTISNATGGTFVINGQWPYNNTLTSVALAYNASAATIQAALQTMFGSANVTVTGSGPFVITFGGMLANRPIPLMTTTSSLTGSSPTATIANTTAGVTAGQYTTYASGNSDGSQAARVILAIGCTVDASGLITFSSTSGQVGGWWGERRATAPAYFKGIFQTSQLVGLDANAVTNLGGHLVEGTVTNGIIEIG